jgi:WhiB family redox-sensing transcriptional regulator
MSKTFLTLVIPAPGSNTQPPPCTNEDPELFFPTSESPDYQPQIRRAKAVCRKCPITTKTNCLEFALETGDKHAILGGTTPSERNVIHAKRIKRAEREAARRERANSTTKKAA